MSRSLRHPGPLVLVGLLAASLACVSRQGTPPAGPASVSSPVAASDGLPGHPGELAYGPLRFELPPVERFRHQIAGGPPVFVAEDHALPLVDVSVIVRSGSYLEAPERPGVARMVGSLLRKGGAGDLSAQELDQRADVLAAELASSSGDTSSGASMNCLSTTLDACLDLFFAMLREPRFEAGRLAVEKASAREAMKQRNDEPGGILGREWRWLLNGDRHYAGRVLTATELDAITRDDLVAFHRRTWRPENMVFSVAGDVDTAAILSNLERRLAGWPGEPSPSPWPPVGPAFTPQPGLYHVEKDVPQGAVFIGHLTRQRAGWDDPDAFATLVMNEILGGAGFSSRITSRVRSDEGLAYSAGSRFSLGDFWPGEFRIGFQSKSATVALAAKIALEEVARIRDQPVTDAELEAARNSLIDSFPSDFESPSAVAGIYARDAYLGRPSSHWQTWRDNARKVTAADVQRAAREYLRPENLVIAVVGKWADIAPGDSRGRAKMADLGTVTHLPLRDPLTLQPLASP
jgi:zinc protease